MREELDTHRLYKTRYTPWLSYRITAARWLWYWRRLYCWYVRSRTSLNDVLAVEDVEDGLVYKEDEDGEGVVGCSPPRHGFRPPIKDFRFQRPVPRPMHDECDEPGRSGTLINSTAPLV